MVNQQSERGVPLTESYFQTTMALSGLFSMRKVLLLLQRQSLKLDISQVKMFVMQLMLLQVNFMIKILKNINFIGLQVKSLQQMN